MKKYILTIICLGVFASVSSWGQTTADAGSSSPMITVDCKSVCVLEAVFLDRETLFRTAPTPQIIEQDYDYKISLRDVKTWGKFGALCEHLQASTRQNGAVKSEFRYALIGYAQDGKRVFSLYLDYLTRNGQLNGENVIVSPETKRWIEQTFAKP